MVVANLLVAMKILTMENMLLAIAMLAMEAKVLLGVVLQPHVQHIYCHWR